MLARLLCAIALLWAVVLPLLHGHPPSASAHIGQAVHASDTVHPVAAAASVDMPEVAAAAAHGGGHAELPLGMLAGMAFVMLATKVLGVLPLRRLTRAWLTSVARPRPRGSPIVRHEVARV